MIYLFLIGIVAAIYFLTTPVSKITGGGLPADGPQGTWSGDWDGPYYVGNMLGIISGPDNDRVISTPTGNVKYNPVADNTTVPPAQKYDYKGDLQGTEFYSEQDSYL